LKTFRLSVALFGTFLLSHCTSEQDVVNHLETMQRFRNNYRLTIKALEDSMQSHVNYIRICQGTLKERKRIIKLFEPEHRLYMDSLQAEADNLNSQSDSIKSLVHEHVKLWEASEVKISAWIIRFQSGKMNAGVLVDSLKIAENQIIAATKEADDLREKLQLTANRGKSVCQEYDKNFKNARVLYGPRLTAEYNKLMSEGL
jgi:hypothetical protein